MMGFSWIFQKINHPDSWYPREKKEALYGNPALKKGCLMTSPFT